VIKDFDDTIENAMLAAIVQSSEDAIISKTLDGIITSWNPAAEKLFGYTAKEMIGSSITKLFPPDRLFEEPDIIARIQNGEMVEHFETQRLSKDGNLVDISLTISPIKDSDGKVIGASKIARDITKAKIAEEKIKESERQLKQITESIPQMVWVCNEKGEVIYFNQQWYEFTGTLEKDMMGHQWATLLHPDDKANALEKWNYAQQTLTPVSVEYRLRSASGNYHWVLSKGSPIVDMKGQLQKWFGSCTLIDEQKEFYRLLEAEVAERTNELKTEKELSDTIINTTLDLIGVYDKELRILGFNKACEDFFHVKKEEVIGKVLTEYFPSTKGGQGERDLLRAMKGETIHNTVYHSPVSGKYYENFISPLKDASGEIYGAVAIAHDITENVKATEKIKQSEEKFNKLFAASPLGLVLSELPSGNIMDANEIYFETIGYTREECIGKTSLGLNLIDTTDRQKILNELHKNGYVKGVEVEIRTKSGTKIPILNSIEKISIGEREFFLSAIIDISDRKHNEKKIEEKNIELQKMNKELESFTYISSHDLQEPLRKIQTFASIIIDKETQNLSENGKDFLRRMSEAAIRMQTLLQDLLAFSRVNTSERKFERINLRKIIEEVEEEYSEIIEEKKATIEVGEMSEVKIIPFQFRQLFHNLMSNALKFSKANTPPHIIIKSEMITHHPSLVPEGRPVCHITFSDNGIGFEPHFSEKIFEVFQRLHGKDEYNGTGIGLAIVKKIVDIHHGQITATSELGKGARFDIYFPV
jgi:PAS domain S-box-containing protein